MFMMQLIDGHEIPTVTAADLLGFQARHFPPSQPHEQNQPHAHSEADDGLGHYDDGVKRTLTDEQIAMFRHSEIQKLLRERELKTENELESEQYSANAPTEVQDDAYESQVSEKLHADLEKSISKKRKRSKKKQPWSHRGFIREQDNVQAESIELDY